MILCVVILIFFQRNERDNAKGAIYANLAYVLYQKLIPYQKGVGRTLLMEVLKVVDVASVHTHIDKGQYAQIESVMQTGARHKMITLDQRLAQLVDENHLTPDEAIKYARHPESMKQAMQKHQ